MELCSTNATDVGTNIKRILKDGKVEPAVRRPLGDCIEFYSTALDNVQDAMEAFRVKDYATALSDVGTAGIFADTCKDGFTEFGLDFGPLSKQHDDFFQLVIISLGIINKILGRPIILQ
ncbi:hypothetical protein MKW98_015771 [Papaver atlanticum]|uniref:Pectinesterase inhibitor domain-containing protein n=1 Tax=Papaver atlanticum TaxID=357466 RepID=A0AAD4XLJ9_9MAGN|nr:hypothetical protein MKW98_015771 [Papaver atlanticum]